MQRFQKFENVDQLLAELESRLPTACAAFNMVKSYPKFKDDMKLLVLSKSSLETAWILIMNQLGDNSQEITISVPEEPFADFSREIVKEAFMASNILDWERPYRFCSLDPRTTQIFIELCFQEKGHIIELLPDIVYYMDKDGLESLAANNPTSYNEDILVKPLNDDAGAEFILKTWRHAGPGTDKIIPPLLERNSTSGVYINGKPVAGVVQNSLGYLGMLFTLPEYRKKGYAKICMLHAMRDMANQGYVPACSVDTFNAASQAFQVSLGLKPLPGVVHYIFRNPDPY